MKVYKVMDRLLPLLEELHLLEQSVLMERTSMENQRVHHALKAARGKELHYFTTLVVRKSKGRGNHPTTRSGALKTFKRPGRA